MFLCGFMCVKKMFLKRQVGDSSMLASAHITAWKKNESEKQKKVNITLSVENVSQN